MSSIRECSDLLLARLGELDVRTVDDWAGDIDELIKKASRLPGLFLVYTGAAFEPQKIIGSVHADYQAEWTVVVIDKNLRAADAAAAGCYTLIDGVRDKLIGFGLLGRPLWPVDERLIFSGGGKMAYALTYAHDNRI